MKSYALIASYKGTRVIVGLPRLTLDSIKKRQACGEGKSN